MALIDQLNDAVFDYINDDKADQLLHDFVQLVAENYEHHQARATSLAPIVDKLVSILPPSDQ